MKRPAKSVMTGITALILLLTGFQVALLLARNIFSEADDGGRREESVSRSVPHAKDYGGSPVPVEDSAYRANVSPEDFKPIPINLNRADSVALLDLPGVGPYYASRIIRYRERLGSYAVKEQLLEIRGIDYEKYCRMAPEIEILEEDIHAPDIWSLPADSISSHPYLDAYSARAIVVFRENHPETSWKIDSLLKAGVISERSAAGLKLYFD